MEILKYVPDQVLPEEIVDTATKGASYRQSHGGCWMKCSNS